MSSSPLRTFSLGFFMLASLGGCASAESVPAEDDVTEDPRHHVQFENVKMTELMVGLPGESFYSRYDPIPCGLAVGSGPKVTSLRLSGSTAVGHNLKVDLYAGTKICRTMFFRTTRITTDYYSHQIYLEHSDVDTVRGRADSKPIIFLKGSDQGNGYDLTVDLGNMRDKDSTKAVSIRADKKVTVSGKVRDPWNTKQSLVVPN